MGKGSAVQRFVVGQQKSAAERGSAPLLHEPWTFGRGSSPAQPGHVFTLCAFALLNSAREVFALASG
jgi:hypothetical protein